ncbi:MAG: alpha/beta hydrolase-fold protein [Promethearchaeota archaeon]
MSENDLENRSKTDNFHSKCLEGNPLDGPVDRDIRIYLPPGYYENKEKRYPVIYFLHGYAGNNESWTVTALHDKDRGIPLDIIPKKILKEVDLDRMPTYEILDDLIINGELAPFILVQPDGSLHKPHKDGLNGLKGTPVTKGSFYVNSPYIGNYMDYIIKDVINYIDENYRTIPDKQHRVLMGGSMGGFGALYVAIHHPEKFISVGALSPGNLGDFDLLNWKLRVPLVERLFGNKVSEMFGDRTWDDILDTVDLIFSRDDPLLPSIKRDEKGKIVDLKKEAVDNWQKYDINYVLKNNPEALKQVHLILTCEKTDEFGLSTAAENIHKTLKKLGIDHKFDFFSDPKAALSPHMLGIGYKIIPAIQFCLQYMD